MADRTLTLLKGLVAALKADAGVSAITSRVFSQVPQRTSYPYVKIQLQAEDAGVKDLTRQDFRISVQSFAREDGTESAVEIAGNLQSAVFAALDRQEASVTMDSGELTYLQFEGGLDLFEEDDGKTYQSVLFFKAITE